MDDPAASTGTTLLVHSTTAVGVFVAAMRGQADQLREQEALVRLDRPDAVHRMRVTSRRLRSLLAATRPLLEQGRTAPLREELRWLGQVLGGARDVEVLQARLAGRLAALPDGVVPVGTTPSRLLGAPSHATGAPIRGEALDAAGARGAVLAALDGDRYRRLLDALDRLLAEPPVTRETKLRAGTRRAARREHRRVRRALHAAPRGPAGRDEALHEVRKATKRLRYTSEAVAGVHGRPARRLARRATDLQEVLGEHQDAVVAQHLLREAAARGVSAEDAFVLGVLTGLEQAAADSAVAQADRAARRLERAAARWFG